MEHGVFCVGASVYSTHMRHTYGIFVAVIVTIAIIGIYYQNMDKGLLSESDAVAVLKAAYPEFQNYPNNSLPPQTIRTEKEADGWYVAFVQEGSGRPILGAKCYFVSNDKQIRETGTFAPADLNESGFSIKTCTTL